MAITLQTVAVDAKPAKVHTTIPIKPQATSQQSLKKLRSPTLLRLPAELRHKIYRLALTDLEPFIDPCIYFHPGQTIKSPFHRIPSIGLGLLRSCRQVHAEATALDCLYRDNVFQFTTVTHCHKFLTLLGSERASQIRILGINLRLIAQGDAVAANEWLFYTSETACGGLWTQRYLGSLKADMPNLKCIRLDLFGWCRPGYGEHRWEYFRSLLKHLRGLECLVVGGEVKLRNLDLAFSEPWAPELFLTNNTIDRSKESSPYRGTMADLMLPALMCDGQEKGAKPENLEILWSIANGAVKLELSKRSYTARNLSAIDINRWKAPWSSPYYRSSGAVSSSCTWEEYERQLNTYRPRPNSAAIPFHDIVVLNRNQPNGAVV